jgi:hypothetical protein
MSRTSTSYIACQYTLFEKQVDTGSVITDFTAKRTVTRSTIRSDIVRVPDRKYRISKGLDASTAYSASGAYTEFKLYQGRPWVWKQGTNHISATHSGCYSTVGVVPDFVIPSDQQWQCVVKAQTRFAADVKQKRSQFSGPVFLAEFREACKLIKRPAQALWKHLDDYLWNCYKAGRRNKRALNLPLNGERILRTVNGLYLELTFAAKPLLADTLGLAQGLADWQTSRMSPMCRGNANVKDRIGIPASVSSVSTICNQRTFGTSEQEFGATVRGKLRADATLPPAGSAARLIQVLGFNIEEFVPTLYELVPFSFVLDYFSNVGQILNAQCTDLSWVEWSTLTTYSRLKTAEFCQLQPSQPYWQYTAVGNKLFGTALSSRWSFNRGPNPQVGLLEKLDFMDASDLHWLNVGSLILALSRRTSTSL